MVTQFRIKNKGKGVLSITPEDLEEISPDVLKRAEFVLSAAQIASLQPGQSRTPFVVIPSPGEGKYLQLLGGSAEVTTNRTPFVSLARQTMRITINNAPLQNYLNLSNFTTSQNNRLSTMSMTLTSSPNQLNDDSPAIISMASEFAVIGDSTIKGVIYYTVEEGTDAGQALEEVELIAERRIAL